MVKKNKHRFSLFCCLLIALLGFGACKQKKANPPKVHQKNKQVHSSPQPITDRKTPLENNYNNAKQIKESKTDYETMECVYGPPPTYEF